MTIRAPKTPTFQVNFTELLLFVTFPIVQWVMDYNIDFPDSLVTERKVEN